MAWGLKYIHAGCTEDGLSEEIRISEEDWTGGSTEVDAAPVPFIKTYEADTIYEPVIASTATVSLVCDENFDLEFLWTADEKKYRVDRYLDGELDWRGFIIPNGFSYDYRGGLYYAVITASDGLSTLKNVPFLSESGELYNLVDLTYNDGARYPFVLIFTEILKKLNLDINLWTCIGIRESRMPITGDREADPLAYSTVDVRTYINDTQRDDIPYWQDAGSVWDCDRVLRNGLTIWGARLYQDRGVWRIKYVNDDTATSDRQWRKYNTAATYLGKETVGDNLSVQCIDDVLINDNHIMSMDRVYAQVRVNYKYTFVREGDSPENLIKNGNLFWPEAFPQPNNWQRIGGIDIIRAPNSNVDIHGLSGGAARDAALRSTPFDVSQGDNIVLSWWQRTPPVGLLGTFGLYTIMIETESISENNYFLVWNGGDGATQKYVWVEETSARYVQMYGYGTPTDTDSWMHVKPELPAAPASGKFIIYVHGLGSPSFSNLPSAAALYMARYTFPIKTWASQTENGELSVVDNVAYAVRDSLSYLTVGTFFAGLIKNISSEEVPKIHPYLYPEAPRQNYTDRNDPIEIYNGDTVDVNHVSSIQVDGVTGKLYWDTWDGKYGYSSLGLLLARSIAEQYWLPNRVLEGDFQHADLNMSVRITLESLPEVVFIVQRGSNNTKHYIWGGTTLRQISGAIIPEGGSDDGNTINPVWRDTGKVRCVKENGVNTGDVEKQQQDVNPASSSFGQLRWVPTGEDTTMCPIGDPSYYLWGAEPEVYDTDNFIDSPFVADNNTVTVSFSNEGGKYLYFLHLESIGLITSVLDQLGNETISDWQYLTDEVIGGFTYKVFRMNYVTTIYSGVPMIFYFI